jgi:RND family efflux transporter MFP subunit
MLRRMTSIVGVTLALGGMGGCQQAAQEGAETGVPVAVQSVSLGTVRQYLEFNADIKAALDVKVFSKVPDRIEAYFVDEADAVRAGDPIARIAATTIEQAVRQAEAGLAAARSQEANLKSEYERAVRLQREDAMSQQQFDAIRTQYEAVTAQVHQAEAAVIMAKSQYKDATITSPIAGVIAKRYFEAGDMANPAMPVVSVVQMDQVKIEVEVTETDLGRLGVGLQAEVRVPAYPDEIFAGRVVRISPILDPLTRMATVEVLVANEDHRLKPGMYGEVEITTGFLEDVLVIPRHAAIESTSRQSAGGSDRVVKNYFVYIVDDSLRARQRQLLAEYVNHQVIAARDGVRPGERLVVSGQNNLRDGMPVFIPGPGGTE